MRNPAIQTLVLVFALLTGACAGRQVRTQPFSAPPRAEPSLTVSAPTPAVEAPVAEQAPAIETAPVAEPPAPPSDEPTLTGQQRIDADVARMLAENDAALRAAAEKMHRTYAPASPAANDQIVAALRPAKRARRASAPAVKDDAAMAVVGSLAAAPAVVQVPAAPAAPSIVIPPAPQGASALDTAGPPKDPAPPDRGIGLMPDPEAVAISQAYRNAYLLNVAFALMLGTIIALGLTWLRKRRLADIASTPYDHMPDGVLVLEIVGGRVVGRNMIPAGTSAPRSEPDASVTQAQMDDIEKTWNAEGDAMEEVPSQEPPIPVHDRFDHSDAEMVVEPPSPAPAAAPADPAADDAKPRLASGSGRIISSSEELLSVSGATHVPDPPPRESRPEPVTAPKVIIYEDDSSSTSAHAAAPTASN